TIVAEEGGPGFATTASGFEYERLFGPLLGDRNLLMMDYRGTGGSAAIDCAPLQTYGGGAGPLSFAAAVAACGAQLNSTYRNGRGSFVHASDLFGTSQDVRDLAAILRALHQGPVDYYGDSYGSFTGQVFAARYPQMLRTLMLDSTYPTIRQDPFDRLGQDEIRFGFSAVCARSLDCSAAALGSPLSRLALLAARLDRAPLTGTTQTPDGTSVGVRIAGPEVWALLRSAGDEPGPYRNMDAAGRAYLYAGDPAPLLRLYAWTFYGPANVLESYREFSVGMYIADTCTVYLNPFDIKSSIPQRRAQYANAIAALPASYAYPVPNRDVFASPVESYDNCITWPAPVHNDPIVTKGPPLVPSTLPVLALSGDLDTESSPGDTRQAAAALGPSVTFVSLPNEIHIPVLLDPFNCASAIVVGFVQHPGTANIACTARIPEVRTVGVFPLHLSDQPPATARPGNIASTDDLRLAAIAVEALGDALMGAATVYADYGANCRSGYCGLGLRGGSFRASSNLSQIELRNVAYSADTVANGGATVSSARFPSDPGYVHAASISARTADGRHRISVDVRYDGRAPRALASIVGTAENGAALRATVPAP
ncbi:MAG: alpha/beta hydrolase, partial [Candidatus Eremiobacteraeota bacterium]|nr:alpha/beta hydrolase [Candidatus Eremiobacteraeota bacterium]